MSSPTISDNATPLASTRKRRASLLVALGTTVVAVALFGLVAERNAFWNLCLLVTIVLVTWTAAIRILPVRRVFLALSTVAATLTVVELGFREFRTTEGRQFVNVRQVPDVGYGPAPARTVTSSRVIDGKTIYEVDSTIDANGLRVSPPSAPDPAATVLCFGGSFMYGEGVRDHETLPFRVGARSQGSVKIYNFAFFGYGPHQMLAMLETGSVARIVEPQGKVTAIYLMIEDHVRRCAGLSEWGMDGPRYVLDEGVVRRAGTFADRVPVIYKSEIFKRIRRRTAIEQPHHRTLLVAIVDAARRRFEALYPGGIFHVLLWPGPRNEEFGTALRESGLTVRVLELPPGDLYIPGDGHPNARAHDAAAAFVLREILGVR